MSDDLRVTTAATEHGEAPPPFALRDDLVVDRPLWWREHGAAAGYDGPAPFARSIEARYRTVWSWWTRGSKPQWRWTRRIARALGLSIDDVLGALWGERLGDPCRCGCGGTYELPANERARNFGVRRVCAGAHCDQETQYGPGQWASHSILCRSCSNRGERVARITIECVGWRDGDRTRHARKCPRRIRRTEAQLRRFHGGGPSQRWGPGPRIIEVGTYERPFVDAEAGTFRSPFCSSASIRGDYLRDRLLLAGFASFAELAPALPAPYATVLNWHAGSHPDFLSLLRLSRTLRTPPDELIVELWGERIGDPCPCGCGGMLTWPGARHARRLGCLRRCARCGRAKRYPGAYHHSRLCRPCSHRTDHVLMACEGCGGEQPYRPGDLRGRLRQGRFVGARIDWRRKRGTYPRCAKCAWSQNGHDNAAKIVKRIGRKGLRERGRQSWEGVSDEERRERLAHARAARGPVAHTETARLNMAGSHLAPRLSGHLYVCRVCGLLGYQAKGDADHWIDCHMRCLVAWRQDHGLAGDISAYPSRRRGHRLDADKLMDSYEMVVLHVLREETLGRLAERFDFDDLSTVEKRISRFFELLPLDDRGGRWLQRRAEVLRSARERG